MASRKQNNDESFVVLALPAPGPNSKPPKRRSYVVPRKKRNSPAEQQDKASSNEAIAEGTPTIRPSGSKQHYADCADTKEAADILMDINLQAKNMNQSLRSAEDSIAITMLQESTTFAHGGAQIMEEATGFGQQTDTVDNIQQNQEDPNQPTIFGQPADTVENNVQQNQEEPIGFNQQQPDLADGGPQIPEEAASDPDEDMNDVFEFALNNSILDLD